MRNKKVLHTIAVLALLAFAATGCGGGSGGTAGGGASAPAGSVETREIVIGHDFPVDMAPLGTAYAAMGEYVYEKSGGTLNFVQAGNGSLVTDANFIDGVMDGVVDMGHSLATTAAGVIPEAACLGIPGYFGGSDWLAFCEDVRKPLTDIYAKYGLYYFAADYQATGTFVSTKKQIVTPEDCAGQIIRASGTALANAIELWGGSPTVVSLGDCATALERGTIDAMYTSYTLIGEQHFYELAKYVTRTPICETWGSTLLRMETYNSLTDEQRKIIDEAALIYSARAQEEYQPIKKQRDEEIEAYGAPTYDLSDEEARAFTDKCKPLFEEFGKSTNELGLELLKVIYKHNGWEWTFSAGAGKFAGIGRKTRKKPLPCIGERFLRVAGYLK
jgi:TRAP-type C4-dicarboxylate transport system substrate-binding protein